MPQKFKCSTCKTDLIVLKLDVGKFAGCPECGEWNEVPENMETTGDPLNCKIKKKAHVEELLAHKKKEQIVTEEENIQAEQDIHKEESEEIPVNDELEDEKQEDEQQFTEKQKAFFHDSATHSPQDNIHIFMDSDRTENTMTFLDYLKQVTPHIYATPAFIIINTLVFLLMSFSGVSLFTPELKALIPWGIKHSQLIVENNEWWRLVTCMFVHIGIFHFLINMVLLWFLGSITERVYGRIAFALVYIVSGIAGNVASLFFTALGASAGASGAIMGIVGALIPFMINKDLALPRSLTQRTAILVMVISVIGISSGFLLEYIDNAAHIGGFLAGFGTGFLLRRSLPPVQDEDAMKKKYLVASGIGVLILIAGIAGGNLFLKPVVPLIKIFEYLQDQEYESALGVLNEYPDVLSEIPDGQKHEAIIYGNAGWENYLKGDFQRCIDLSEKAYSIDPVTGIYARYNIALCYLRLGFIKKSRDLYTELETSTVKANIENRNGAITDLKDLIKMGIHADEAKSILVEIFGVDI